MTITPVSTCLGNCWMSCLNLAGSGGQKWNLRRLNSTLLYASSDRWKQAAIDLECRSAACLTSVVSLVSVLGGICTKLVLLCFEVISIFSWSNTCAAFRSISCQLTALVVKGPSELHPVFTVSLNRVAVDLEQVKGAVA